jgi:hypothetical protein
MDAVDRQSRRPAGARHLDAEADERVHGPSRDG